MKQRLADYLADRLVEAGICQAFTVTGGGAMHLTTRWAIRRGCTVSITTTSRPAPWRRRHMRGFTTGSRRCA